MQRSVIIAIAFLLGISAIAKGQLSWSKIFTPGTVNQFALGSDGSLYVSVIDSATGFIVYRTNDLGSHWLKIYAGGSVSAITCDSNGSVIIIDDFPKISFDQGASWNVLGLYLSNVEATGVALYATNPATLYRSLDHGSTWETLSNDPTLGDWRWIFCGSNDRVIADMSTCSCWEFYENSKQVVDDTLASIDVLTDLSPPTNVLFDRNGYIYALYLGYLIRLPSNATHWETYDSLFGSMSQQHIPMASPNATTIVSVDSFATYASYDHGDSWNVISTGLPIQDYPRPIVTFADDGSGYALGDEGALYHTAFFRSSVIAPQVQPQPSLYPIPCTSFLIIHGKDIERVEIINLLGVARIDREFHQESDPQLDVSTLAPGVYSVMVISGGNTEVVRMVKM